MKAPPQPQSFSPCHAHLHAVPFSFPSRLGGGGGGAAAAAAAASNLQMSLPKSRTIYRKSLLESQKLITSISNKKTCKPHCGSSNDINRPKLKDLAAFLDENGDIGDMDGYLNYLSLEYDSVWDTKPSWCQPWTIISTGVLIVTASWFILHSVIVTSVVLTLICAWWYIFLVSYPKAYSDMIADRRKRVSSGVEDTYGLGRLEVQNEGGDTGFNKK